MSDLLKPEYETFIFEFRGKKVMIDADLATLYDVKTKVLKQQVKRNIERFPEDFMFELTEIEKEDLITNCDRLASLKFSYILPMAFTEQGVAMLSSVLRSDKAIAINIEIIRAFARYRALIRENEDLRKEIQKLDKKLGEAFKFLLKKIDALRAGKKEKPKPRAPIGYKKKGED